MHLPIKRSKKLAPVQEKQQHDPWGYRVEYEEPSNNNGKRPNDSPRSKNSPHELDPSRDASHSSMSETPDNRVGPIQTLQQYRAEVPSMDMYPQHFLSQQDAEPQIPWTFSYQETTF